jgi:hypothetical protein
MNPLESFINVSFLGGLPILSSAKTRSINAENPKGEVGGGAKEDPKGEGPAKRLGKGWKVRPCIDLQPSETVTLAEIEGPAVIQHIWITATDAAYRNCILRMYWDGEKTPSVEVPLGDFFVNGNAIRHDVNSLPIAVNPAGGFNSYWPLPFRKSCKITIENQYWKPIGGFFYQFTYALTEVPSEAAYFHAQWRRAMTERSNPDYVILDGVKGKGHYVGTMLAWTALSNGWWGEGEIKFYIDGDKEYPTICGTGLEDYFGGAWGFDDPSREYSTPFLGVPLVHRVPLEVNKYDLYRWHILDPIRFEKDLRVTIQALGWWPDGTFQPLADDVASVAYWYQTEPHAPYPEMLCKEDRWPR